MMDLVRCELLLGYVASDWIWIKLATMGGFAGVRAPFFRMVMDDWRLNEVSNVEGGRLCVCCVG